MYFGTLRMHQIAPFYQIFTPGPPSKNLNTHKYRAIYCNIWCKKAKPPFFYIFLASGGGGLLPPRTPLVKCECIFALTCASGLILEKNMVQNLGCCLIILNC